MPGTVVICCPYVVREGIALIEVWVNVFALKPLKHVYTFSRSTSMGNSILLCLLVDRRQMELWTASAWLWPAPSTAGAPCWLWAATTVASSSGTSSRGASPKSSAHTSTRSALYGETRRALTGHVPHGSGDITVSEPWVGLVLSQWLDGINNLWLD